MKKTQLKNSLLLLLTATIWGVAFVAQSVGMDHVGSVYFQRCSKHHRRNRPDSMHFLSGSQKICPKRGTAIASTTGRTDRYTDSRRCLLRYSSGTCQQFSADGHPVYNCRTCRIYHCLLYCYRSDSWPFLSEEKMRRHHLDRCCTCTGRTVSALHHRRFFRWKRGSAGHGMFPAVFLTYSGNRLFFAQG